MNARWSIDAAVLARKTSAKATLRRAMHYSQASVMIRRWDISFAKRQWGRRAVVLTPAIDIRPQPPVKAAPLRKHNAPVPKNLPKNIVARLRKAKAKSKGGKPSLAGLAPQRRRGEPPKGFRPGQPASSTQPPATAPKKKSKKERKSTKAKGPQVLGLTASDKLIRQKPKAVHTKTRGSRRKQSTELLADEPSRRRHKETVEEEPDAELPALEDAPISPAPEQ